MNVAGAILGAVALLLHGALFLLAAPLADGVRLTTGALLRGYPADVPGWPPRSWRQLAWLSRKECLRSTAGGWRFIQASLALSLCLALLVPSFCTGMATAPLSDLPLLLLLFGAARLLVLLPLLLDGGSRAMAVVPGAAARLALAAVPCLLAAVALAGLCGSSGLDGILVSIQVRTASGGTADAVALVLALCGLVAGGEVEALVSPWSGVDRAAVLLVLMVQRAAWITLVGDLLLPWLLPSASAPLWWIPAILGWLLKLVVGAALLGALEAGTAWSTPSRRFGLAGVALLLAVLAPMLALRGS